MEKFWKFSTVHKVRKSLKDGPNFEIVLLATEKYNQGLPQQIKDILDGSFSLLQAKCVQSIRKNSGKRAVYSVVHMPSGTADQINKN